MEPSLNFRRKQLQVGLIALLFIIAHVMLSFYVSVAPRRLVPRNKITDVYRHLVVLGPFFTESRITYSHFLFVRYKQGNAWSPMKEYSKEYFAHYNQNPWRLDKLAYISYEKQLAFEVGTIADGKPFDAVKGSAAFRELNAFLTHELLPKQIDSVQLMYALDYYDPNSGSYAPDTLFAYTYDPKVVGNAKD